MNMLRPLFVITLALASCTFAEEKPAPAFTPEERATWQALAQEQRVNAAELRAAKSEEARLNEVGVRLYTQACADRGITAASFKALTEVCEVNLEKGTVARRVLQPAAKSPEVPK